VCIKQKSKPLSKTVSLLLGKELVYVQFYTWQLYTYHCLHLKIKDDLRVRFKEIHMDPKLMRGRPVVVNFMYHFTGAWDPQTCGQTWSWGCLWVCFWVRLACGSVDWVKQLSPTSNQLEVWIRTKGLGKKRAPSVCLPLEWDISFLFWTELKYCLFQSLRLLDIFLGIITLVS
jgi:hypothetical protein